MGWFGQNVSRRRFLAAAAAVPGALFFDPRRALADSLVRRPATPPSPSPADLSAPRHIAWLWQFGSSLTPVGIREVLAAHQLGLAIKTHDGSDWMSTFDPSPHAVSDPDSLSELRTFFEEGNVPLHAWCVVHGEDPLVEAQLASSVLDAGARILFLDVEAHEGFWTGSAADAVTYGTELRRLQPDATLIMSLDARPWELPKIPLAEFASFSDALAPQTYWAIFRSADNLEKFREAGDDPGPEGMTPRFALQSAVRHLQHLGLPIHPIGDGTTSDTGEWREFLTETYASQSEALSVWRYGLGEAPLWELLRDNPPRPRLYVVQPGDSLSRIAGEWGTTVEAIVGANNLADPNLLRIGQMLEIPGSISLAPVVAVPVHYTVVAGDSLTTIAERFDTTVEAIASANELPSVDSLTVGQLLLTPGPGAVTPVPVHYTVVAGDSLTTIAGRFSTTVEAIVSANRLADANSLTIGQTLVIPPPGAVTSAPVHYTVVAGDSLTAIASRFSTTAEAIASANGLANMNSLTIGQTLLIPDRLPDPEQYHYTVLPGDSLTAIADRFATTIGAIASANGLTDVNSLVVGQTLAIPAPTATTEPYRYTVVAGDSLTAIAERFGSTVASLRSANRLGSGSLLRIGDILLIP